MVPTANDLRTGRWLRLTGAAAAVAMVVLSGQRGLALTLLGVSTALATLFLRRPATGGRGGMLYRWLTGALTSVGWNRTAHRLSGAHSWLQPDGASVQDHGRRRVSAGATGSADGSGPGAAVAPPAAGEDA